jgi:ATP-dependent DNA helicase RecG
MDYLRTTILYETVQKVPDRAEAIRFWSYPYEALEEAVVNSLYHRDYSQHEPVEITIEPDGIDILNCPGPDRSISMESIVKGDMLKSRRYRNRYLGDFLKELDLTEGRSTGVPTIQEKLADNGSPRASFETTEDRLTFLIHIPIHPGCESNPLAVGGVKSPVGSETSSERGSETQPKSSERSSVTKEESSERKKKSSERILDLIKNKPKISAAEIAMEIDMSTRGVEKQIRKLREAGIIKRIGADFGGYWEIIEQ